MSRRLAIAAAILLTGAQLTAAATVPYSADTVQFQAGQGMNTGKIYVGEAATRIEYQQDGRPVIEIAMPKEKMLRVLFPLDRTYMEFKDPPASGISGEKPAEPCRPAPELFCRREGEDQVGSVKAARWMIKPRNAPGPIYVWWDSERRMPVRQQMFDGSSMMAVMTGLVDYEGQKVERWEIIQTSPNGTYKSGMALYSPQLQTTVAERGPGPGMREMRNIKAAAPDARLFEIPQGYKKIDPLKPEGSGSGGKDNQSGPADSQQMQQGAAPAPQPQAAPPPPPVAAQPQPQQQQPQRPAAAPPAGPFGAMPGSPPPSPPMPQQPQAGTAPGAAAGLQPWPGYPGYGNSDRFPPMAGPPSHGNPSGNWGGYPRPTFPGQRPYPNAPQPMIRPQAATSPAAPLTVQPMPQAVPPAGQSRQVSAPGTAPAQPDHRLMAPQQGMRHDMQPGIVPRWQPMPGYGPMPGMMFGGPGTSAGQNNYFTHQGMAPGGYPPSPPGYVPAPPPAVPQGAPQTAPQAGASANAPAEQRR